MAEQRTLNPQVLGSNPRGRTTKALLREDLGDDATVVELFTRSALEDDRSPTTLREYRNKIRLHLNPAVGHVRVRSA